MEKLSIIIPQYRTEDYIRLCLRALRKHTGGDAEVIVVDNNSSDGSIEYLKKVKWITLVENNSGSIGSAAHKEALDLGIQKATGGWVCLFHSDTIVLKDSWDAVLMDRVRKAGAAGLSTQVRDINPFEPWSEGLKARLSELRKRAKQKLISKVPREEKIMSYCFIVRKSVVEQSGFSFSRAEGDVVSSFYARVIKGKHPFLLLGRDELMPLLWHTSNITSILTGQITEESLVRKFNAKTGSLMRSRAVQELLADPSLDR
ncbi:MAG: glycosyltransferase family 2 protein [Deltaproteobacteria bacterium]|nr:glycosyltransferase family 2 protein [Deltaproteobacteria bacterium]